MSSLVRTLGAATAALASVAAAIIPAASPNNPKPVYANEEVTTTEPTTTTTVAVTTTTQPPPPPPRVSSIRDRIARCEGWPRYVHRDHGPRSTASGKFGFLDSTWNGYGGYRRAMDAPEHVQDAAFDALYARAGTRPWNASRRCWQRSR